MQSSYPDNLLIKDRPKLPSSAFQDDDKLYRGFDKADLDENGEIDVARIRFPDVSCFWSKFSIPTDVKYRKNGDKTDGCYSFSVLTSRYKNMATPVHDPGHDNDYPNYAHVEVRVLYNGEDVLFEPPKGRELKPKSKRFEYRQNIKNSLTVECDAEK